MIEDTHCLCVLGLLSDTLRTAWPGSSFSSSFGLILGDTQYEPISFCDSGPNECQFCYSSGWR
jgi:hypothetical protein